MAVPIRLEAVSAMLIDKLDRGVRRRTSGHIRDAVTIFQARDHSR